MILCTPGGALTIVPLKVVHLAQSDTEGGANCAAYRLHSSLLGAGVQSIFHCGRKFRKTSDIVEASCAGRVGSKVVAYVNARALRAFPQRNGPFSPTRFSYGHLNSRLLAGADVVCLHWIAGGFLNPSDIKRIGRPLVWRLSDLWPFTGGCHYPGSCRRFEDECGYCPVLGSARLPDLSTEGFRARLDAFQHLDLTIVAPSRWIAEQARNSKIFGQRRIEHIPTGIDLKIFRTQRDRLAIRRSLRLPTAGKLILFGALGATTDPRKGFRHLKEAAHALCASNGDAATLVVFGDGQNSNVEFDLPVPVVNIGLVTDEAKLAEVFAAADVFVAPAAEDNLPNTVLEALACGTPVVAFAAGGIPDAVQHMENGFLASPQAGAELGAGIGWVLADEGRLSQLRLAARTFAEAHFDLSDCAARYMDLFSQIAKPRA